MPNVRDGGPRGPTLEAVADQSRKLVIGGEKDPLVNAVIVEKAAAALGALRVLMPGVDHGLIIE